MRRGSTLRTDWSRPPALRQPRRSPPHPCAGTHHALPPAARSTAGSRPLAPKRRDTSPDVFAAAAPARTAAPSRSDGFKIILINSNPATIMTDPDLADRTYIEPITAEIVAKIVEQERPDAILPTLGGQTASKRSSELAS